MTAPSEPARPMAIEDRADETTPDIRPSRYPFRSLGHDQGAYFFLPADTLQVVAIPTGSITSKAYLLAIAPLDWWESIFPTKQGVDWTAAANACIRWCEREGTFSGRTVRGRGAWYDQGSSVLHLGDRLIVDGERMGLIDHPSDYIYESAPALELHSGVEPATAREARALRDLLDAVYWKRPISAILVAGWAYLAPICGALQWRPHVWITGQRGTGKSWIQENIIRPVVGTCAVIAQSNSTEAGIRQTMGHDARPILFDEAEAENRRDQHRVQSVLELARQASSENSAEIVKGTASGRAMTFRVRSMFLLGSINVTLAQAADVTRFTICALDRPPSGKQGSDQFDSLRDATRDILTPDFCARLRARAYREIPTIRINAATIGRAVAEHLGDQRIGDQIGTLLAGAYNMKQEGVVDIDVARRMVRSMDWSEEHEQHDSASDQDRLVNELLAKKVRVETNHGQVDRTVAELIDCGIGGQTRGIERTDAKEALERCGLKLDGDRSLRVANNHPWIRSALDDTPWSGGWRQILSYCGGSASCGPTKFAGQLSRATSVPLDQIIGSIGYADDVP